MVPLPLLVPLKLIGGALGKVPWYGWVIAVSLALAAWNRHQARSVRAEFDQAKVAAAAERAASAAEATAESSRRRRVQQEAVDAANLKSTQLERSLAASADAGQRLRQRLAALDAQRCAGDTAAGSGGQAASAAADLRAELSRRLDEAADGVARFAERAAIAGDTCERSYDALTPKK